MALTRWDPFRDLMSIQEQMNQLFQDTLSRLSCHRQGEELSGSWVPPVDIYETEDSIIVVAELPGVDQANISIEAQENTLTLKGERRQTQEITRRNYHRIERGYGSFQRTFTLPRSIDQRKAKAIYKDGILEITLPKVEAIKPNQVQIEVE